MITTRGNESYAGYRRENSEKDKENPDEPVDDGVGEGDEMAGGAFTTGTWYKTASALLSISDLWEWWLCLSVGGGGEENTENS